MSSRSISDLTAFYHRHIDEVMALHQEALLIQNLSLAGEFLGLFEALLSSHIEIEDSLVLPLFEQQGVESRWPSLLYFKEHEKIAMMLAKIKDQFGLLANKQSADLRRAILSLLDYEKSFKGVLEHHTEREEQALLPDLEKVLDSKQLEELTTRAKKSWHSLSEKQGQTLERLRRQLDLV